jgi:hypothetical protein
MIRDEYFPRNERANTARVACRLAQAIDRKEPCAMISMADGESAVLWAAKGFGQYHYLSTWGFSTEDRLGVAQQLAAAIPCCDIIGLPHTGPEAHKPYMGPKLREAMRLWGIEPKPEALIGDSLLEVYLLFDGWLWSLMENRKVLVVTNEADQVVAGLKSRVAPAGINAFAPDGMWRAEDATGIMLEEGLAGSAKCLDQAANLPWKPDLCILGAGSRAAHLCVAIAEMHRIPVIELGSMMMCFHRATELGGYYQWYQEGG